MFEILERQKFLSFNITYSGKFADIHEIVQSKLLGMILKDNIRVYTQYATPSIRFMLKC